MKKLFILLCVVVFQNAVFATDFSVYKLDSGQTVAIKKVSTNPIVTIDTWIKTGSIDENDKNNGVAHFLEHLFFKGTLKHPAGEMDKILDSKGAVTNAATSKDFTHYYITIPSEYFDLALELHSDMLLNPQIPRKELEKERKVVLEEIAKDLNSPSNLTFETLNEMLYKTHPYKRKVIGKKEIIENITREEILNFYDAHYSPSNMVTVIVGDVEVEPALEKVKAAFKVEPRKNIKTKYPKEKPIRSQKYKENYYPTESGYMLIGFDGVNAINKDMYALDVLATILGEGRSSRFYNKIKEQGQLAFDISAANLTYRDGGNFLINASFLPTQKDKLKKAIFSEIKAVQSNEISDNDLKIAKNIIERNTYYSRESVSNIASEMGYTVVLTDNPKNYDDYLKGILGVTKSDVKMVANKYLGENKSAISITLPLSEKDASSVTKLEKTISTHNAKLIKSAYNTEKYILDNGATLLVNPNKQNDIVAISISAKGGEFSEKVKGTATLTAATMLKGTKNYSSFELAQILEEKGINISPKSGADFFNVDVLTTKQQLNETMQLLSEVINNSKFDDYEVEKTRTNIINNIKESRDVPVTRALEGYKTIIYENTVYSNSTKVLEKALPNVQKSDIVNYYNEIFFPQNLVISVNGDVDEKTLINEFSEMFSQKRGKVFNYECHEKDFTTRTESKSVISQIKELQASWLILGWQVSGNNNLKEFASLQIIDTLLGTGMSSRLFRNIREQEGLAYQIGSGYSPNVLRGAFTLYIGTNPKTLQLAKNKMMFEINLLKTEFIGNKELQEAKDQLLGKYILNLETNLDKANALGLYEASGRGFEFVTEYSDLIKSITSSDILAVANKYFNNNYVESVVDTEK